MITRIRTWARWEWHRRVELTNGLYLILLDRFVKALVLVISGVGLLVAAHDPVLHRHIEAFDQQLDLAQGQNVVASLLDRVIDAYLKLHRSGVMLLAVGAFIYAALEIIELTALLYRRRWAEYLIFCTTAALLPAEVVAILLHVSVLRIVTFCINLAIVVYLIWRKRLFWDREPEQKPPKAPLEA